MRYVIPAYWGASLDHDASKLPSGFSMNRDTLYLVRSGVVVGLHEIIECYNLALSSICYFLPPF